MIKPRVWLLALLGAAALIVYALWAGKAFAQEEIVAVSKKQLEQLVAEHVATLQALDAAEREIARLKVKLACV